MSHEACIRAYFAAWMSKNPSSLGALFSDDVVYSECYGPEYHGLRQIRKWFSDWNQKGTVLRWDIKHVLERGNTMCVEWYFQCEYEGVTDGFDGVSWIEFDEDGRICALREFQSKAEHHFPYGSENR